MASLISLSVTEMRAGLLRREFSAEELTRAHLERIKSTNETFNSFISICEDYALARAKSADKILAEKQDKSPTLTGIPIAIKDAIVTKGIETTAASKILKGFVSPYSATVIRKLEDNGAVIVGKANLDEFAMGSTNENSAFGPVKNPWDVTRVSGGSSGGSAVAVSLGQAPISLGSDTGGSIRLPASFNGIVGVKPTYGRVSRYGLIAYASSLDQIGPFARTVMDAAITLGAIAGYDDDHDSTSVKENVPDYAAILSAAKSNALSGVRIGVPKEYFVAGLHKAVEETVRDTMKMLAGMGAQLVEVSLPHTEYALATYYIVALAEAASNLSRYDGVRYGHRSASRGSVSQMYEMTRAEGFGTEVKRRIMLGTYVLSAGYYDAYYLKAQKVRRLIADDFRLAFEKQCDMIIAPVSPFAAFKIGEKIDSPLQMYLADIFTVTANLAGIPGITVPIRADEQGMPIGVQLLGKPFDEARLLIAAQAIEQEARFDSAAMTRAH